MKIKIERTAHSSLSMKATNPAGRELLMDGAPDIGGADTGFRPMEMVAAALAGCSTIDVLLILKKKRAEVRDLKIEVEAKREQGKVPSLFETINVHYNFFGDIKPEAAEQALQLSFEKYCSVSKILEPTCKVSYTYSIQP